MEEMLRSTKDERVTDVLWIVRILTVSMSSPNTEIIIFTTYLVKSTWENMVPLESLEIFYPV